MSIQLRFGSQSDARRDDCRLRLPAHEADADARQVVRLRADWSAMFAMRGYAERATWLFGHGGAVLECVERRLPGCVHRGALADALVRLDVSRWRTALARRANGVQYLEFYGADGRCVAVLKLEECRQTIDELIWLLAEDEFMPAAREAAPPTRIIDGDALRSTLRVLERRDDFDRVVSAWGVRRSQALALAGRSVAQRLSGTILGRAFREAFRSGIRFRVCVENAGVSALWSPAPEAVTIARDHVEVRSRFGRLHVARSAAAWLVHLTGHDAGGPSLEAEGDDGGRVRVDVADAWGQRMRWRELCAGFATGG